MRVTEDRAAALVLATCPGVEPATIRTLARQLGGPAAAWRADASAWRSVCGIREQTVKRLDQWRHRTDPARVEAALAQRGIRVWVQGDDAYPRALLDLADPPVAVFVAGQAETLHAQPMVAVVGTRRASPYGGEAAAWIAEAMAKAGVAVVSGMAVGIDAAAHVACLDAGGVSVAVLATGVDRCYPSSHEHLYRRLLARGAVISEYAPGTPVARHRFPERNRLIAALGQLTVVVQAGVKSGALRTADHALELGRDVFAVPGPVTTVNFQGCHRLIQDGAQLLADPHDLLLALGLDVTYEKRDDARVPARWRPLYDALDADLTAGQLAVMLGMEPARVYTGLLELEMAGWVRRLPGGVYRRVTG